MEKEFIQERITQLRLQKGVSEYKMSYDLGHSRGYINNISSGKVLPSMLEFLAICDYFGISPADFFEEDNHYPQLLKEAVDLLKLLNESDLHLAIQTLERWLKTICAQ